jgi:hypothetical protein
MHGAKVKTLKVSLKKSQFLSCDTFVANERHEGKSTIVTGYIVLP